MIHLKYSFQTHFLSVRRWSTDPNRLSQERSWKSTQLTPLPPQWCTRGLVCECHRSLFSGQTWVTWGWCCQGGNITGNHNHKAGWELITLGLGGNYLEGCASVKWGRRPRRKMRDEVRNLSREWARGARGPGRAAASWGRNKIRAPGKWPLGEGVSSPGIPDMIKELEKMQSGSR